MVNKTTFKQYLLEAEEKMPRAEDVHDLFASIVDGHFTKDGSKLKVTGDFYCNNNQLKSLEGCPQTVGGYFSCSDNKLESLEGCPQTVGGGFYCWNNKKLTSLARINFYVHEITGIANFAGCPIKSNILGLLKIRGLKKVKFTDKKLQEIMNRHLPMGDSTDCIDDLLDAGYSKEYCKW